MADPLQDLLQGALTVTVERGLAESRTIELVVPDELLERHQHVILENNLTRKGVWSTDASRTPHQEVIRFETEDLVGHLVMESGFGRLSTSEMELVSWIFAQWQRRETPDDPWVYTSIHALATGLGGTWGGSRSAFIKQSLVRLDRVRFTARVWSASKKRLSTEHFGIFDHVHIEEPIDAIGRWRENDEAPVQIKLGHFMHEQLRRGQFHRYAWHILRGRLRSPLSKRLYVFLDGQRGGETPEGWLYERPIDDRLIATLGVRDTQVRRVRRKLRDACAEVLAADPTYKDLCVSETSEGWMLRRLKAAPDKA